MKKFKKNIAALLCLCLILSLTACLSGNDTENSSITASFPQSGESVPPESAPEQETVTEEPAGESSEETEASANEKKGLPEGVVLSGIGFTVIDTPDEVTYGEDGIWQSANFYDYVFASEPNENELKKYGIGDTICGLTVKSASYLFANMYMDNEYHDGGCRINSYADFEGSLAITGTLSIADEDSPNLFYKQNDILFTPDEAAFPRMGGFFEGENYYAVFCGHMGDEGLCEDVKGLAAGKDVRAKVTLSDVTLIVQMGTPVSGRAYCKIDGVEFL